MIARSLIRKDAHRTNFLIMPSRLLLQSSSLPSRYYVKVVCTGLIPFCFEVNSVKTLKWVYVRLICVRLSKASPRVSINDAAGQNEVWVLLSICSSSDRERKKLTWNVTLTSLRGFLPRSLGLFDLVISQPSQPSKDQQHAWRFYVVIPSIGLNRYNHPVALERLFCLPRFKCLKMKNLGWRTKVGTGDLRDKVKADELVKRCTIERN